MAQKAVAQADPRQLNAMARQMVLNNAVEMKQPIASGTLTGTPGGQVLNIPFRNVGLIKRFVIEISFNLAQSAAETLTRTPLGPSNILSQVVLTDLSNQARVNTTGWHLHLLGTARRQAAFGAAFTNDSPVATGSVFPVITAPASITTSQAVRMFYEVPVAYGDFDLRGGIYANVVNATGNLQFTINPNLVIGSTGSQTLAAYKSSTAATGTITSFNYTVYQVYLDQIPMQNGQPILPMLDLSTAYVLNNTVFTGLSQGQDNAVPYANFREFMSTCAIYDQAGVLNVGSDVNYFALQSANYTNIWKVDPYLAALDTRLEIGDDFPNGCYYFNHRKRPISTVQFGNMQLVMNPSSVAGVTSQLLVGFEALAVINMVTQAGSIPSN